MSYAIEDRKSKIQNHLVVFLVVLLLGFGCASKDPISRLVANPPQSSRKPSVVDAPPAAPLEDVVRRALGPEAKYKITEIRRVRLADGANCTAALVEFEDHEKKIVLLYYAGQERGGWWAEIYDAK